MNNLEVRTVAFETTGGEGNKITGRAVVFNSLSKTLKTDRGDSFKEMLAPGVFTRSLKERPDVLALNQHNPAQILGRVASGTLKLEERADGLYVDLDLPNTSYANDLKESIKRGDVAGFSFGFKPVKQRTYTRSDVKIRELVDVDLVEVSLVSSPAYNQTEVALRSDGIVWEIEKTEAAPAEGVDMTFYELRQRHATNNLMRGTTSCSQNNN